MSLKLPEPLPYSYVDKMLDLTYKFSHDVWEDHEGIEWESHSCRFQETQRPTSTYPRSMFNTIPLPRYDWMEEDEEGYVDGTELTSGFCWRAEPLSDEELEYLIENLE